MIAAQKSPKITFIAQISNTIGRNEIYNKIYIKDLYDKFCISSRNAKKQEEFNIKLNLELSESEQILVIYNIFEISSLNLNINACHLCSIYSELKRR